VIAVNRAPGSAVVPNSSPAIRIWALEEIGRNSVNPCKAPKNIASNKAAPRVGLN
jgi:hypothetical protein